MFWKALYHTFIMGGVCTTKPLNDDQNGICVKWDQNDTKEHRQRRIVLYRARL